MLSVRSGQSADGLWVIVMEVTRIVGLSALALGLVCACTTDNSDDARSSLGSGTNGGMSGDGLANTNSDGTGFGNR